MSVLLWQEQRHPPAAQPPSGLPCIAGTRCSVLSPHGSQGCTAVVLQAFVSLLRDLCRRLGLIPREAPRQLLDLWRLIFSVPKTAARQQGNSLGGAPTRSAFEPAALDAFALLRKLA